MKILHLDTEKTFRGGEQQLLYLAQGLRQEGIDSIIACKDALFEKSKALGFETINANNSYAFKNLLFAAKQCDYLHAHASRAHSLGIILKLLTQKPLVYTRRVDYKQNKIAKLKYKLTDRIVSVSNFVNQVLYKNYKVNSEIIFDAVDRALLDKVDNEKVNHIRAEYGPIIIGNIGALTKQKDHKTLINACELLDSKYKFLVLGNGLLRDSLESCVKQKNLDKNFFFLGFKEDIYNYLAAFDVFVISSEYEGLCSSILQAFLFKKPVVATDVGGVSELIGSDRGLLVPKKDPKALALAIESLIKNKYLSAQLVEKSSEFVKKFDYMDMTKKYIKIYKTLS